MARAYCPNCFNERSFDITRCEGDYRIFCLTCNASWNSLEEMNYAIPYDIAKMRMKKQSKAN